MRALSTVLGLSACLLGSAFPSHQVRWSPAVGSLSSAVGSPRLAAIPRRSPAWSCAVVRQLHAQEERDGRRAAIGRVLGRFCPPDLRLHVLLHLGWAET